MTPNEFSLHLSWSPRVNGVTPGTPGFYLRAQYANEGEAQGVVKGTYSNGYGGNGSLVSDEFLMTLARLLEAHNLLVPGVTGNDLGGKLSQFQHDKQHVALEDKRARLDKLREEVAELERLFPEPEPATCLCGRDDRCRFPPGELLCPNVDDDDLR